MLSLQFTSGYTFYRIEIRGANHTIFARQLIVQREVTKIRMIGLDGQEIRLFIPTVLIGGQQRIPLG
ncbi:hypothetical protein D3C80_1715170 [compost metagenome]